MFASDCLVYVANFETPKNVRRAALESLADAGLMRLGRRTVVFDFGTDNETRALDKAGLSGLASE